MKTIFLVILITGLNLLTASEYEVLIAISKHDASKTKKITINRRFSKEEQAKKFISDLNFINQNYLYPTNLGIMLMQMKPVDTEIVALTNLGTVNMIYVEQMRKVEST